MSIATTTELAAAISSAWTQRPVARLLLLEYLQGALAVAPHVSRTKGQNPGIALEGASGVLFGVSTFLRSDATCAIVRLTTFDAATTYGITVNSTAYSTAGAASAAAALTELRDDIETAAASDATAVRAALIRLDRTQGAYDALLISRAHNETGSPRALLFGEPTASGGTGDINVYVDAEDASLDIWAKVADAPDSPISIPPMRVANAAVESINEVAPRFKSATGRLNVSGYQSIWLMVGDVSVPAGNHASVQGLCLPFVAVSPLEAT